MPQWSPNKEARPNPFPILMQASCLEHLIKDDVSNTGKDKLEKITISESKLVLKNFSKFKL